MKIRNIVWILFVFGALGFISCKGEPKTKTTKPKKKVVIPAFDGQGAYDYIQKQVDFGNRVPGTDSHKACRDWLVSEFRTLGTEVQVQEFKASFLTVKNAEAYNIIASYNPSAKKRVLLAAHWDTRMIADKDQTRIDEPIDGADDGGSGVGVLLQIAKTLQSNPIDLGVDFILFDAEDNGEDGKDAPETWCLGSQYWKNNKHERNYSAKFGILLDMVGSKNARFPMEGYSRRDAGTYVNKIWTLAERMGYGDLFQKVNAGGITDDHVYVNQARIPMVDIINLPGDLESRDEENDIFGHYHHRHTDNMDNIDVNTLRRVGQVVTAVIFKESEGSF